MYGICHLQRLGPAALVLATTPSRARSFKTAAFLLQNLSLHLMLLPCTHPLLLHISLPPRRPAHLHLPFSSPSVRALSSSSSAAATVNNFNHLIQTLCKQGNLKQAIHLLPREPNPTQRTFEALILACSQHNSPSFGSIVHRRISDDGSDQDPFLATRLVDMYSQFGSLNDARHVFDETRDKTIFLWNAFLRALTIGDLSEEALSICQDMARLAVSWDSFTYSYALKACLASSAHPWLVSYRVRQIHGHVIRHGYDSRVHVATTLVDSYAKIGRVLYSQRVFDGMLVRNVVSWSAMIACYAKNERPFEALEVFREMTEREVEAVPNSVTMVSVLQACAGLAALGLGKVVHGFVLRRGLDSVVSVINALIAMYVKSGCLETGRRIFDRLGGRRDVVSWNSMISGYGIYGLGTEAIETFKQMISTGISPSPVTFVSVLGACSHVGLVEEGKRLFESMSREYGIIPCAEHYACMVDLLGRSGRLEEAAKLVADMRIEPGPTVWGSLLGACRIHSHVEFAERACVRLFELEPMNAGNYVLLANIYAGARMWDEVSRVRRLLDVQGLKKLSGCSWIEVKKKVHPFVSVDEMNPHIEQLHALLVELVKEMKGAGYFPHTEVVLYDLDQEEKERILLGHSEKLAVAFGLINCGKGEVIRITKNLRLCEDCHSVTKFISKFAKREILVRDVNRFHHFRDGVCSCSDYW